MERGRDFNPISSILTLSVEFLMGSYIKPSKGRGHVPLLKFFSAQVPLAIAPNYSFVS